MTIEASQYINQLNVSYPRSTDLLKEGDDHIRMIKANLLNTFPNFTGPTDVSSDFLNNLNNNFTTSPGGITFNKGFLVGPNSVADFNFARLRNVPTPSLPQDAATKQYVDARYVASSNGQFKDGDSAYDIAKANGFNGTEAQWLASLKGQKGDTGPQGPAGAVPNNAVLTSGTQTIAGVKTFSDTPVVTGLTVKGATGAGVKALNYTPTGTVLEVGEDQTNIHFLGHSFDFGNKVISRVGTPTAATDAVNKSYVDDFVVTHQTNAVVAVAAPTKAEYDALVSKFNALLAAMQASGLMATS